MYWSDNKIHRKRKGSLLGTTLLFGLLFGLLLGGTLNNWWSFPFATNEAQAETAFEEDEIPTAATMTKTVPPPVPTAVSASSVAVAMAPDFTLPNLFDETTTLSLSDFSGMPVILNFWASWCVPCKVEMSALQQAYEKYRDAGLIIIGVNQTFIDELDAAREFVNELALTFPNVRDDTGNTSEGLYQVMGLPTSIFIAPDGEIVHKQIGQMTDVQIDTFSQQLVAGEAITQ